MTFANSNVLSIMLLLEQYPDLVSPLAEILKEELYRQSEQYEIRNAEMVAEHKSELYLLEVGLRDEMEEKISGIENERETHRVALDAFDHNFDRQKEHYDQEIANMTNDYNDLMKEFEKIRTQRNSLATVCKQLNKQIVDLTNELLIKKE